MPRKKSTSDEYILDVARTIFLRDGLGASTKVIARAAGVSEGVLFQRYHSKQKLFFKSMRVPLPDITMVMSDAESPSTALERFSLNILRYYRDIMPIILLFMAHPDRETVFKHDPDAARKVLSDAFGLEARMGVFLEQNNLVGQRDSQAVASLLLSSLIVRALHEQMGLDDSSSELGWLKSVTAALAD